MIDDPNWVDNYLKKEIQRTFISSAKVIEEKLYKSSNVYEMFGVDIVMDENFKLFIIEINASPMVVGTAKKKNEILFNMMNGLYRIIFA